MRVILRSPFSPWSGYGRDGIGLARALMDRRHEVTLAPSDVATPLPRDVAGLFTEKVGPSDVAIHHIEPHRVKLVGSDAQLSRRNIYWSMWGWRNFPDPDRVPNEEAKWVSRLAENIENFDWVVVYDSDSAEAFKDHVDPDKLLILQGGYAAEDWAPSDQRRTPGSPYVFGMVGALGLRKGAYHAYQAFCELKEEHSDAFNAELVFCSTVPVFPPEVQLQPGVSQRLARLLPEELRTVYQSLDTLLAPSMADAKHLPPIEALACGTPVILSDIVGHRTWATSDIATWVSTHPASLPTPEVTYQGREVDLESLKAAMWEHYTKPYDQLMKAELGAKMLPRSLDWTRCLERLGLLTGTLL